MHYYEALSSEILLTNLLLFPQCGHIKRPYEYDYRKIYTRSLCLPHTVPLKSSQHSGALFPASGAWLSSAPPAALEAYQHCASVKPRWIDFMLEEPLPADQLEFFRQQLECIASTPSLMHQNKPLKGEDNFAFLAKRFLSAWHTDGWFAQQDFVKGAGYESDCAKELGLAYRLDLERSDILRSAWLQVHEKTSPFVRLMYADMHFIALRNWMQERFYPTAAIARLASDLFQGWAKTAVDIYFDLYDPDAPPSIFQLSIQIRLFICQYYGLIPDSSDWMGFIGPLFQRTLPIVFERWPMLMGMMGDSFAKPMQGARYHPEAALEIYQMHGDHYRIAKLYENPNLPVYGPMNQVVTHLLQAAFGFAFEGSWENQAPPENPVRHHIFALLALVKWFDAGKIIIEPKPGNRSAWYQAICQQQRILSPLFEQIENGLSLLEAYFPPGGRWNHSRHAIADFFFELENKRCHDPVFSTCLNHAPATPDRTLINSGVLVCVDKKLALEAGQIVQLYTDAKGEYSYLKCYGYPLYPISWYLVSNHSSSEVTKLSLNAIYIAQQAKWKTFSREREVVVEWLALSMEPSAVVGS